MEIIISDRYGYWEGIAANSPEAAIRISSNLSPEASLEYASTKFVAYGDELTDGEIEMHNENIRFMLGL